ncbi:MAG: oxygen-independent coproporphyrinogen III oxidase-like protein [Burkholderiales bacterium]|nr:oxygen-independent coproporphyrinogen III oxidase-like protein [Burkholderiales bacterium]
MGLTSLPPLSLYIHIPWCARKCPYCDFNSHEAKGEIDEKAYVDALTLDLESFLPEIWGRPVRSVFFGGGTPSLLSPASIERILVRVRERVRLDADAEITLEANPGTMDSGRFPAFRDAGINRISLGIQSFDDRHLASLGRIHDGRQAAHAVESALHHFGNVNLDLMYALPMQKLEDAKSDLEMAASFDPPHLSAYHLTIEPNTLFHAHPPEVPCEDEAFEMQILVEEWLGAKGYENYETSAFAKQGFRCRHNLNYWQFGDYIGIGAGAHAKISRHDGISRQMRWKNPASYLKKVLEGNPLQSRQEIDEVSFEFMMNALRLREGFSLNLFEERTGLSRLAVLSQLDEAERLGFVSRDPFRVVPTEKGRRFLNDLLQIFLE